MPVHAQSASLSTLPPEFPTETAVIVAATQEFFDTVEARTRSEAVPTITAPSFVSPASALGGEGQMDALTEKGPLRNLTGYQINWYPVDRFLGSVDFMGTWDGNRNLVCGYLTWDVSDPAQPVLERVEANFVDVASLAKQGDQAIHTALLNANCAFGAIDANYAFFE